MLIIILFLLLELLGLEGVVFCLLRPHRWNHKARHHQPLQKPMWKKLWNVLWLQTRKRLGFHLGKFSMAWLVLTGVLRLLIIIHFNTTIADWERNNLLELSVFLKGNSEFTLSNNHHIVWKKGIEKGSTQNISSKWLLECNLFHYVYQVWSSAP